MLHLSDIRKLERCPRYFWLSKRIKKDFVPYINYNERMSELVKERLMIQNAFEGKPNDESEPTLQAYEKGMPLVNARFSYRDLRVRVDVLIQEDDHTLLYMCYKNCFPKEREAQKIADTITVLEHYDIHVDEIYAIHLNAAYVRVDALDVESLLVIDEYLYNNKNKAQHRIASLVEEVRRELDDIIDELHVVENMEDVKAKRTTACTRGSKCPYYEHCFLEEGDADSILHLVQSSQKFAMHEEGLHSLKDVDVERIEGTRHQYAQIMAAKQGGLYVDKGALNCWMRDHIHYPMSYLDFEWETFAFPPYKGMKPYDVLPFQYSLHVEEAGKALTHTGYIGEGDCREEFIQHLLSEVPKEGSILVYNMEGAEKLRLIQLSIQFPQYEKQLRQIWGRMVDLSLPFSTGNIYDLRMQGGYSLKTLVPLFSDYDYQNLEISYGMDAVEKWRQYSNSEDETEKETIYNQLMEYCSMDTYAEYIIYHALEKMV